VYTSTYGGGLVAGDEARLLVELEESATCVLTTQSATKVYRSPTGRACVQSLDARVAAGGLLVLAPDAVSCFADAVFDQTQTVQLEKDAAVVVVDWLTSGRRDRGERWAFSSYRNRLDVIVDDSLVLRESVLLERNAVSRNSLYSVRDYNCFASVIAIGGDVGARLEEGMKHSRQPTEDRQGDLRCACSSIDSGCVVRIIGRTPELVGAEIHKSLAFLEPDLGDELWARKW